MILAMSQFVGGVIGLVIGCIILIAVAEFLYQTGRGR